jgi:hypothetical protein
MKKISSLFVVCLAVWSGKVAFSMDVQIYVSTGSVRGVTEAVLTTFVYQGNTAHLNFEVCRDVFQATEGSWISVPVGAPHEEILSEGILKTNLRIDQFRSLTGEFEFHRDHKLVGSASVSIPNWNLQEALTLPRFTLGRKGLSSEVVKGVCDGRPQPYVTIGGDQIPLP